jgi:hypothetical protein
MLLSEVVTAEYAKHVETLYPPPPPQQCKP